MELAVPDEDTLRAHQAAYYDVLEQVIDLDDHQLAEVQRRQTFATYIFAYFEDSVDWDKFSDTEEEDFEFLQNGNEIALAAMDAEVAYRAHGRKSDPHDQPHEALLMTANRKPKTPTAEPAAAAAPSPETPEVTTTYLRQLDDYIAVRSPKTQRDANILDGIRRELTRRHDDIEAFILEKMNEGFSLADIHELYSVEVALMPIVEHKDGGRVKVRWPFVFVERDAS